MKKKSPFLLTALILFSSAFGFSQSIAIEGAWQSKSGEKELVILFQDGYFTQTQYNANEYIKSWGGPYAIKDNQVEVSVEFNSADSAEVGDKPIFTFSLNNEILEIQLEATPVRYVRIDNGKAPLAGVWKINAREQEGKLVTIHHTGARKTLKILTGTRFQWFAINPETKQFSGTGGGAYTFENGKYTENILFFSRDNSRVGAHLTFDGKIENGQWHHSGLSSKGDKIYEVWGKVNTKK
jgi:hypothetical protein